MKLSELILKYRLEHSLSQRQLAARCNLSTGYISLIEKDINPQTGKPMVPTLQVLNKLATGMGLSVDELLSSCDDMDVNLSAAAESTSANRSFSLTPHEQSVIIAYRSQPHMQEAVDRLLAIPSEDSKQKQA